MTVPAEALLIEFRTSKMAPASGGSREFAGMLPAVDEFHHRYEFIDVYLIVSAYVAADRRG